MNEDGLREWKVYRHYTGTNHHGELATLWAKNSEAAIKKLGELIQDQHGKWRSWERGEMLVLRAAGQESSVHLVKVDVGNVQISRVGAVA